MTELKPYQWLDANQLKLIAIVAMTVDHIAWLLFPGYAAGAVPIVMHIIGRITCPVMCFFIAEGFHYTRDRKKYALRLFMLAVVSHFAYMLASNSYADWHSFIPFYYGDVLNQTSVVWSLLGGLLMLWLCEDEKRSMGVKVAGILLICLITLPSDWSCIAALCVLSIGSNRANRRNRSRGVFFMWRSMQWCTSSRWISCTDCSSYVWCLLSRCWRCIMASAVKTKRSTR